MTAVSSTVSCSKPGGQDFRRHAQLGQDLGNRQAVIDVGLAGIALLAAVRLLGHAVGALNQLLVSKCVSFRELFEQVFEGNGSGGRFHDPYSTASRWLLRLSGL